MQHPNDVISAETTPVAGGTPSSLDDLPMFTMKRNVVVETCSDSNQTAAAPTELGMNESNVSDGLRTLIEVSLVLKALAPCLATSATAQLRIFLTTLSFVDVLSHVHRPITIAAHV